jgi:chemotaxis protein MotB
MNQKGVAMRRYAVVLALLSIALAASGCVSKDEFLKKSDEAAVCAAKLAKQTQDGLALAKELSTAQSDLAAVRRRIDECTAQVQSLSRERDELRSQLAAAQAVGDELKNQNEKLNSLLKSKDVSQAQVIQETMDLNKKLRDANADLREQLARKEGELRAAEEKLAQATANLAGLQQQIDQLNRQKDEDLARLKATYDELVGSLKGEIEAGQVQISRMKDRLSVNLVEKILFDSGRAEIKPAGLEVLAKVGEQLAKVKSKRVQIEGHTDNVPISGKLQERFPSNWELSAARAMAVVHFLQDKVKIDPVLLSAAGYGEYQPAQGNDSVEGKAANRRIEIVLLPLYEKASEAQEKTAPAAPAQ